MRLVTRGNADRNRTPTASSSRARIRSRCCGVISTFDRRVRRAAAVLRRRDRLFRLRSRAPHRAPARARARRRAHARDGDRHLRLGRRRRSPRAPHAGSSGRGAIPRPTSSGTRWSRAFQRAAAERARAPFRITSPVTSNSRARLTRARSSASRATSRDGDCYQVNLAQRFSAQAAGDPWLAYQALRVMNPAPFAAYLSTPYAHVLSASPERFLQGRERARRNEADQGHAPARRASRGSMRSSRRRCARARRTAPRT